MTSFPTWIIPMAATLTQERFSGPDWLFERKYDGIRLLAFRRGSSVRLYSRNQILQNDVYPSIVRAMQRLPVRDVILDGEVLHDGAFHIFDIPWLDGTERMSLPLMQRGALLAALPLEKPLLRVSELAGDAPWQQACAEGWEGVIAKRRDSSYEQRRSKNWLKMKCEAAQEFVVGGFTDPQGSRVGLGALLVGYYDKDDFVFAGKVGTGFDTKLLNELRQKLSALEIDKSPFTRAVGLPRVRMHWVTPKIVVQVAFLQWTVHGKLRHSRLIGIRTDKSPRDVVRES